MLKLFTFAIGLSLIDASHLPDYIRACKLNDPNLNECATASANAALKVLLSGDRDFDVPKLVPFKVAEVTAEAGDNLKMTLTDIEATGLDTAQLEFEISNDGLNWSSKINLDMIQINAKYKIDGSIMVLPIKGSGNCEIKLENPETKYEIEFEVVDKDGEKYFKRKSSKLTHSMHRSIYNFENLFNGDQRLGEEMNKLMNENWQEMSKTFGPTLDVIVKKIIDTTIDNYVSRIPMDEIFSI